MYNPNEDSNNITPTTARKSASVDIRQIFPARKKDDFLKDLQKDVNTFSKYLDLNNEWRNRFEEFMEGNKSLPLPMIHSLKHCLTLMSIPDDYLICLVAS